MELYIDILGQKNTAHFLSHVVATFLNAIKVEMKDRNSVEGNQWVERDVA